MRKMLTALLAVLATAAVAAPAQATPTIVTLDVAMAPGVQTALRLNARPNERQYAFDHRCPSFEYIATRYTGVRSHGLSCAQVRRMVKLHTPKAYTCHFLPLVTHYIGTGAGVPSYSASKARFYCNLNGPGTSYAVTATNLSPSH